MRIEVAKHAGFCYGVKRAVNGVYSLLDELDHPTIVTLGPIIHNETVVSELESKGVYAVDTLDDVPEGAQVVIRSHGVGKSVIDELERRKIRYLDCTCPFVKKIHDTVWEASGRGEEIVIIGNPSHPEVVGVLGWSSNGGTILESYDEVGFYAPKNRTSTVCVVAQTTFNSKKFQDYVEIFQKNEYNINVVDTICHATKERQDEAEALAHVSDGMIVIGGADSSNSKKLYEICKHQCERTVFIQTANMLDEISFDGLECLGITAGASTPNTLIQEVFKACQKK